MCLFKHDFLLHLRLQMSHVNRFQFSFLILVCCIAKFASGTCSISSFSTFTSSSETNGSTLTVSMVKCSSCKSENCCSSCSFLTQFSRYLPRNACWLANTLVWNWWKSSIFRQHCEQITFGNISSSLNYQRKSQIFGFVSNNFWLYFTQTSIWKCAQIVWRIFELCSFSPNNCKPSRLRKQNRQRFSRSISAISVHYTGIGTIITKICIIWELNIYFYICCVCFCCLTDERTRWRTKTWTVYLFALWCTRERLQILSMFNRLLAEWKDSTSTSTSIKKHSATNSIAIDFNSFTENLVKNKWANVR